MTAARKRIEPALALATDRTAKQTVMLAIRKYGANGTILALAEALRDLGAEWQGEKGAAQAVEAITGFSPHVQDDWRWAARCGYCGSCQEYQLVPNPWQGCHSKHPAQGSYSAGHSDEVRDSVKPGPAHPTGGFAHYGCRCAGCR
jgi:hypothetical protein